MRDLWDYYRQQGWRWHVAATLVVAAIFIDRNLAMDAQMLRAPMLIVCGSGLVLLKEFPIGLPHGEIEWFKATIALAAAAILFWGGVLIADDTVRDFVKSETITSGGVWFLLFAILLFSLFLAFIAVFLLWFVPAVWTLYRHGVSRRQANSQGGPNVTVVAKWSEARRLADEALEAAREAGRLEGDPPP